MKSKGFTLVELLAVISILAIVTTIASYSIIHAFLSSKEKILEDRINNINTAAINYAQSNGSILNSQDCQKINEKESTSYDRCKIFTVGELQNLKLLDSNDKDGKIYNEVTKEEMTNDIITVYRKNNRLHAKICLISNGEEC